VVVSRPIETDGEITVTPGMMLPAPSCAWIPIPNAAARTPMSLPPMRSSEPSVTLRSAYITKSATLG
jgi:hypothetical protein